MENKRHPKQPEQKRRKRANGTPDREFANLEFADENDFVNEDDFMELKRRNERRATKDEYK